MPDITMCQGEGCPLKENCFRYKARPYPFGQPYFTESPNEGNQCKYYWQHILKFEEIKHEERPKD